MPRSRRSTCTDCGASGNDEPISKTGRCPRCSAVAVIDAQHQLREGAGPVYERYVAGWLRAHGQAGRPITPYPPDA